MTTRLDTRRREGGFTLIEILIVLIIIAILIAVLWLAMNSAKVQSRANAMKAAAASMDDAFGTFNRMYPPIAAAGADPLGQLPAMMNANPTPGQNPGNNQRLLADETREPLLDNWPANPYANGGVIVRRYTAPAQCNGTGPAGEIWVCRMGGANGAQTYTIVAFAKDKDGNPYRVYTASHGTRSK